MAMERRKGREQSADAWVRLAQETFVFDFPCCLEFVCRSSWEDAAPRVPGTLMVMLDDSRWKLWAHDRDRSESLFLSGDSLEEVFRSLEQLLESGGGEWRRDKVSSSGNGRRRS